MALSARCATGHLSLWERQGVCTVSRLPLLRAKCRALPGCALYARLRAGVMRELVPQFSIKLNIPLTNPGKMRKGRIFLYCFFCKFRKI